MTGAREPHSLHELLDRIGGVGEGEMQVSVELILLVGVIMPALEFIPFSATVAGLVLTLLGLALVARDGLLALLALALLAGGAAVLGASLV